MLTQRGKDLRFQEIYGNITMYGIGGLFDAPEISINNSAIPFSGHFITGIFYDDAREMIPDSNIIEGQIIDLLGMSRIENIELNDESLTFVKVYETSKIPAIVGRPIKHSFWREDEKALNGSYIHPITGKEHNAHGVLYLIDVTPLCLPQVVLKKI